MYSQVIALNYRRSPKVILSVLCSPHVHQQKKKHLQNECRCFRVDQLGLEPRTSRLWVCCSNQLSYKSNREKKWHLWYFGEPWMPFPWVVLPGFEPGMTEPKPVVLPLHHSTILIEAFGEERQGKTRWRGSSFAECGCKVRAFFWISQKLLWKNVEKFHFVCVF